MKHNRLMRCGALVAALAISLVAAISLSGCGESEPTQPQVGEAAEGAYDILVTNGLEADVTSLKIRVAGTEAWGADVMGSDVSFAAGDTVELHYLPKAEGDTYDLLVGQDGADDVEIHNVDLASVKKVTLMFESEVGFVTFEDADGNEGSTKAAALAEKAEEEAKQKAEEEAKQKAEEEAKRKAEEEAARKAEEEAAAAAEAESYYEEESWSDYEDDYYEPQYTETVEYSAPVEYTAPAQSEDECTRDNIVLDN